MLKNILSAWAIFRIAVKCGPMNVIQMLASYGKSSLTVPHIPGYILAMENGAQYGMHSVLHGWVVYGDFYESCYFKMPPTQEQLNEAASMIVMRLEDCDTVN